MDVYEYAMQMEKDGENLYREGARLAAHKGLSAIMTMLADAEVRHYDLFKGMKERRPPRLEESSLLEGVKNVFVKMREEGDLQAVGVSQIDLYRKARDIEKTSEDFYRETASKAEDRPEREAFLRVADEENKHYYVMQQIIDFVSRPEQWLENAEWRHLEEY